MVQMCFSHHESSHGPLILMLELANVFKDGKPWQAMIHFKFRNQIAGENGVLVVNLWLPFSPEPCWDITSRVFLNIVPSWTKIRLLISGQSSPKYKRINRSVTIWQGSPEKAGQCCHFQSDWHWAVSLHSTVHDSALVANTGSSATATVQSKIAWKHVWMTGLTHKCKRNERSLPLHKLNK